MAASNHNVIVTLTGESTGIQKAAKSGAQALQTFNASIQANVQATHQSAASLNTLRVGYSGFVGTVAQAKLVAAQLTAEKARAIKVNEMLTASLTKQELTLLRSNGLMQGMTNASGSASFAVLGLTQGVQDMGNFGMGAAQGIRAVNNNVQQFATALTFASAQAGGLTLALKGMWTALKGPAGILLAFSLVSAAIEWYSNASQRANKETKDLKEGLEGLFSIKSLDNIELAALGLIDVSDAADRIADRYDNAKVSIQNTIQASIEATAKATGASYYSDALNLQLADAAFHKENGEAVEASMLALDKVSAKYRGVAEAQREAAKLALEQQQDARRIVAEMGVDGLAAALSKQAEAVAEFQRIVSKASNVAKSGLGTESEFNKGFSAFSKLLLGINSDLKITETEFAKLSQENGLEEFLNKARKNVKEVRVELTEIEKLERDILASSKMIFSEEQKTIASLKVRLSDMKDLENAQEEGFMLDQQILNLKDKDYVLSLLTTQEQERLNTELAETVRLLAIGAGIRGIELPDLDIDFGTRIETDADKAKKALDKLNRAFSNTAAQGVTSLIDGLAQLGTGQEKNFAVALLLPFAEMAINLGKICIATGIGLLGIQKAFKTLNPAVAIAAGVALVALGSVVKSKIKKTGASVGAGGSSGGGGGSSNAGSSRGVGAVSFGAFSGVTSVASLPSGAGLGLTTGYQPPTLTDYRFEIRGRDLVSVLDMEGGARTRMGARN